MDQAWLCLAGAPFSARISSDQVGSRTVLLGRVNGSGSDQVGSGTVLLGRDNGSSSDQLGSGTLWLGRGNISSLDQAWFGSAGAVDQASLDQA